MKKLIEIIFILCFGAIVFYFPIKTYMQPRAERLFYENRSAEKFPELSMESFFEGDFVSQFEKGFSDNIIHRDKILALHTYVDKYILRKPIVNDVLWQEDEPLLPRLDPAPADREDIQKQSDKMAEGMAFINDIVHKNGGEFYFLGIPEQYSYFRDRYPSYIFNNSDFLDIQEEELFKALDEKGIKYINMNVEFDKLGKKDSFYYSTDHHFTLMGAYEAYKIVMNRFDSETGKNAPVLSESDFEYKEVPNPYFGSRNRKLMGVYKSTEHMYVPEFKNRVPFLRTDNGAVMDSVIYTYAMDENSPETYMTYMLGDIGETIMETHRNSLPNILVFGDSFTNPLEMLFYTGFNESRYIDLRYYDEKKLSEYIEEFKPDLVVMVRDDTKYLDFTGNGVLE